MPPPFGKMLAASAIVCFSFASGTSEASELADSSTFLRFGLGLSFFEDTKFHDGDCSSTEPFALFGCGQGPDGRSRGARGEFDRSMMLEAAIGRRLGSRLDVELAVSYRPELDFSGQSNFTGIALGTAPVFADAWNASLMTNLRLHWENWLTLKKIDYRPFISGGVGLAVNHIGSVEYQFNEIERNDRRFTQSGTQTDLAWSLGSGVEFGLSDGWGLQLAYRYVDLGEVVTDSGDFLMTRDDRADIVLQVEETKASLTSHEVMISLNRFF